MSKYIPPTTILKQIWKYHECLCATKCSDYLSAAVTYIYCAIRHSYMYCTTLYVLAITVNTELMALPILGKVYTVERNISSNARMV